MTPRTPFSLLFLTFIISIIFAIPKSSSSLSTVSISHTPNRTLICALNSQSYINCSSFPATTQNPITSNTSFSAIIGGNGFLCGLRSRSPSNDVLRCWRFSQNSTPPMRTAKRIYIGQPLHDLESGTSHFCALDSGTRRLRCWQWPGFSPPMNRNFSSIAVGGEFICGLSDGGEIGCFGGNSIVVDSRSQPKGNFRIVAAGSRHACAIRVNGSVDCWGEKAGNIPSGEFVSLALGEGRSCAIRSNETAACWGETNFRLPANLTDTHFLEIEAKGSVFCGIRADDYSLLCWGSENFESNHLIFEHVLPGPCRTSTCSCGYLPDYSQFCATGSICRRCEHLPSPDGEENPPALPPSATKTPPTATNDGGRGKREVAFLVVGSVGCFIGLLTAVYFTLLRFRYTRTQSSRVHDSGNLDSEAASPPRPISPRSRHMARAESLQPHMEKRLSHLLSCGPSSNLEEFPLHLLLRITDNFSEHHKIGSGSFGSVYRATLDDGREVAIKRAELTASSSYAGAIGSKQHEKEHAFLSELALLSRLNHKNLAHLIGYSDEANECILIYDFMANGTLHDHLHKLETSPLVSWVARLNVALDAARGIEYLHTYAVPPIIHRDIKSSNILLDAKWAAKVADFGLSLLGPDPDSDSSHLSLRAAGTVGYMDPEYYRLQCLTTKSDVYSFGVMLLELLTGYKAIHRVEECGLPRNIVDFAVPYIVRDEIRDILDPAMVELTPKESEAVAYVGYLAADCVNLEGQDRPSMTDIVSSLERALAACVVQPPMLSRSTTVSSST